MKTLYKVIIVLVAATLLVAALGSAFNQIATSPILDKKLNSQDGDQDLPVPDIPQNITVDPVQNHSPPDANGTILPPELNLTVPNGTIGIDGTSGGNVSGKVFVDKDGDGLADPGEGQSNVGVQLFDRNGTLVGTTQTGPGGSYDFTGVAPGEYNVSTIPSGNGSDSRSITLGNGTLDDVDLKTTPGQITNPTVSTVTDIVSPASQLLIKKGVLFQVTGTVTTASLEPVSGSSVLIFVASDKTTTLRHFIGGGSVANGRFAVDCLIPDDLQLGNYQLIARFLGDGTYKPSESDPPVKVMDDTRLTIDSPDRVIMGYPCTFTFTLRENASAKAVSYAPLSLSGIRSNIITDGFGQARYTMKWSTPGNYSISVTYAGNGTLYGTKAEKKVTVLDVTVDIAPPYLVRGYDNRLFVLVHASELPLVNRTVTVYLENSPIALYRTDREGRFNATVPVSYSHSLGPVQMNFDIPSVKYCEVDLEVMSKTTMSAVIEGDQVNATLYDDHGQVMLRMPIQLQRTDQSRIDSAVSEAGSEFSLPPGQGGDFMVKFNGTSIYRPSSTIVHYSPAGLGATEWLIIGGLLALAVLAAVAFFLFRNRKGRAAARVEVAPVPETPRALPASPYAIRFPEIGDGLPPVWGENDPMLFHVSGGTGEVSLDIDGRGSTVDLGSGSGAYTVKLPKGDHELSVSGPLGTTAVAVRVVDYREETVRLYRSSFESWKVNGAGIADSMTPREMQSTMEGRIDPSLHGQLDVVVSLFELAQFSQRPIGRPEYESMFRASDRVR